MPASGRPRAAKSLGETSSYLRDNPAGNTGFLVDKAKAGSQAAWTALFERYRTMLVANVQARIPGFARRRFDAEDVLLTAFARAWKHIDGFEYRGEDSFRRWLSTLVIHAFENQLRDARPEAGADDGGLSSLEDKQSRSDVELSRETTTMFEALGQMDDQDRDLIVQRDFEHLTFEEIADNLGCPRETVRKLYARALERLKRRMKP